MKRDMELIRQIAFKLETLDEWIQSAEIELENYGPDEIGYHCGLMYDAELFKGEPIDDFSSTCPEFQIFRLTNKGHDFISAARNETVWRKFTAKAKETGTALTIDMTVAWLRNEHARLWGLRTQGE